MTIYVTGTLIKLGRSLAKALAGQGSWSATLPLLDLWCGLVAGSVLGAFSALRSETAALAGATAVALLLAVVVANMDRRSVASEPETGGSDRSLSTG